MPGIRGFISEELGLDKEDTNALIQGYSRNNDGHVDPQAIVHDIRTTAENIVDNLPHAASGYDFNHEIIDCGKDRQADAIHDISRTDAADSCRGSEYANDTDAWSKAIYNECRVIFEDRAFSDGIEGYRDYVDSLPYSGHTINSVADALGEDRNVVRFIADNGDANDFRNFMIDIRPNANDPDDIEDAVWTDHFYPASPLDTGGNGVTTHGCPRAVSDMILDGVKNAIENGTMAGFDRDDIMNGLSAINRADGMTNDEKIDVEKSYVNNYLQNAVPYDFNDVCRSDIDDKADVLKDRLDSIVETKESITEKYETLMNDIEDARASGGMSTEELADRIQDTFTDQGKGINDVYFNDGYRDAEVHYDNAAIYIHAGELMDVMDSVNHAYETINDQSRDALQHGEGIVNAEKISMTITGFYADDARDDVEEEQHQNLNDQTRPMYVVTIDRDAVIDKDDYKNVVGIDPSQDIGGTVTYCITTDGIYAPAQRIGQTGEYDDRDRTSRYECPRENISDSTYKALASDLDQHVDKEVNITMDISDSRIEWKETMFEDRYDHMFDVHYSIDGAEIIHDENSSTYDLATDPKDLQWYYEMHEDETKDMLESGKTFDSVYGLEHYDGADDDPEDAASLDDNDQIEANDSADEIPDETDNVDSADQPEDSEYEEETGQDVDDAENDEDNADMDEYEEEYDEDDWDPV